MGCYIYDFDCQKGRVVRKHIKCRYCLGSDDCPKSEYYSKTVANDYEGCDIGTATAREVELQNGSNNQTYFRAA